MNSKEKLRRSIGVIVLLSGLLCLVLATPIFGLSTLIFPSKFWYATFPVGTQESPTLLTPNQQVQLKAQVVYSDTNVYPWVVLPGNYLTWTVTATVKNAQSNTVVATVSLAGTVVPVDGFGTFLYTGSWLVPQTQGVTYSITFNAIIRDNDNVLVGDPNGQSVTVYAKTPLEEPDGQFTVNGQSATETTTIVALNPALSLGFHPLRNADQITRIYVQVYKGTSLVNELNLVKGSTGDYTAIYMLTSYGTYTLNGFIAWSGGNIQKMSVNGNYNSGGSEDKVSQSVIVEAAAGVAMFAGAVVAVLPSKRFGGY